ncbi:MAG: hypothetical protein M3O31_04635 [Acidobacteriota bacterium]|nr:hypothetical protein [Acidobacteriota bacterium]
MTRAPIGATLSGNTISWTPTAGQSRAPNSFTVTATAPDGGSATQTWAVTPSGTIRISWIDTLWNESGSTTKAFDWSLESRDIAALVPQPDGSFQSLSGSVGASGEFEIPNVPAGYYWLRIGPRDTYWTNSSIFDMGHDIFVPVSKFTSPTTSTTSITFNFTSLEATPAIGLLQFDTPESGALQYRASINAGSTTSLGGAGIGSNLDFSVIKNGFVRQYEAALFGPVNGYVLGPELTLSNLSLTAGGSNTISGALNPTVPASIHLSFQGSAWIPLFDHVAPTTPTATGGGFYLSVQPYIASDGPNVSASNPINLVWTKEYSPNIPISPISPNPPLLFRTGICSANPPLITDVEAGSVQYGDPFPAAWRRTFRVCQNASVVVPVPGTSQTQSINLINDQTTVLPTATVKPVLSGVLNPKINGADLFTASTVSSTGVTLSWDPPAIGIAFGYNVAIMTPTTFLGGTASYSSVATLSTAKTSITIPPNVLAPGRTYLFVITSLADGKANMETSPHRSWLPVANADVISAPITTN